MWYNKKDVKFTMKVSDDSYKWVMSVWTGFEIADRPGFQILNWKGEINEGCTVDKISSGTGTSQPDSWNWSVWDCDQDSGDQQTGIAADRISGALCKWTGTDHRICRVYLSDAAQWWGTEI